MSKRHCTAWAPGPAPYELKKNRRAKPAVSEHVHKELKGLYKEAVAGKARASVAVTRAVNSAIARPTAASVKKIKRAMMSDADFDVALNELLAVNMFTIAPVNTFTAAPRRPPAASARAAPKRLPATFLGHLLSLGRPTAATYTGAWNTSLADAQKNYDADLKAAYAQEAKKAAARRR